jgi:chromosome segregation ATPase
MAEVSAAKAKLKDAAKVAIKGAINRAAAVANAEQKRIVEQEANERSHKGATSAKSIAMEAKAAAKEQIAEEMMTKATKLMAQAKAKTADEPDVAESQGAEAQLAALQKSFAVLKNKEAAQAKIIAQLREQVKQAESKDNEEEQEATKISTEALSCNDMVDKLKTEVSNLKAGAQAAKAQKEGLKNDLTELKQQNEERMADQNREQKQADQMSSDIEKFKTRANTLKGDGVALAKGLKLSQAQVADLKDQLEVSHAETAKVRALLKTATEKGNMLDQCQKSKAQEIDDVRSECADQTKALKEAKAQADTKAMISKRGYELCQAQLQSSRAAGDSMKAAAMQQEANAADLAAKQATMAKVMKKRITAAVTEKIQTEEREKYENKLEKAISKVAATKPISPKCQACAKLSTQERVDTGASCGGC